ncbi:unnamed protein product [Alternaria alternata]
MSQSGRKQPPMRDAYLPDALHEGTEKTPVRVFQRPGAPQADKTREVEAYSFMYKPNMRVHLIDTPGFDDSNRTDADVLRDIAGFLGVAYQKNIRLSGLVYCHRIIDPRMQGSAQRNFHMFRDLCGEDCYRQIALITTHWAYVPPTIGTAREKELIDTEKFWGYMYRKGSHILRHVSDTDRSSAMTILAELIRGDRKVTLDIQREMSEGLGLEQTSAGKRLNADIIEMRKKHREDLKALEQSMKRAMAEKDKEQTQQLEKLLSETEQKIKAGEESQERLKADLQNLQVEREAAMARLQAELKASQDQMAEEQLKFQLRQDQDRAEMQSEKEAHKARMEQLQQQMNRQAEEIKKKAAGSQTDWGSIGNAVSNVVCTIAHIAGTVIEAAIEADREAQRAQSSYSYSYDEPWM